MQRHKNDKYTAICCTEPCQKTHQLQHFSGMFDTAEEAAQAYLQHREVAHPAELEKDRLREPKAAPMVLRAIEIEKLIKSHRNNPTGFKGVAKDKNSFASNCYMPPCKRNNLGYFKLPEEAAQAYLQHVEEIHPEELVKKAKKKTKRKERSMSISPEPPVQPPLLPLFNVF